MSVQILNLFGNSGLSFQARWSLHVAGDICLFPNLVARVLLALGKSPDLFPKSTMVVMASSKEPSSPVDGVFVCLFVFCVSKVHDATRIC